MRFRKLSLIVALLFIVTSAYAAVTVTVNGSNYSIPQTNERGWGTAVTSWIQAISANTLQPTGGSFVLTADADFGANYGLKTSYLLSRTANPSSVGLLRLAKTDTIGWRNNANSGNLLLGIDASDNLTFNGVAFPSLANIVTLDGTQTLTNKTLTAPVINSPTGLVKADVGLGNVDNTSDATKNTAVATLENKTLVAPIISTISNTGTLTLPTSTDTLVGRNTTDTLTNKTLTSPIINSPSGLTKSDVGLGNVDNTSDATKNAAAVVLTNKDIDGGTASNTSRITIPKAAKTTLDGLTRKQGTIVYDTTTNKPYFDDGSNLQVIGSGSGGGANYLVNGDAELGTSSWTAGSGVVLASESTVVIEGLKSIKATLSSVNGDVIYQDQTPTVQLNGVNVAHYIWVKTSASNVQACPRQGGSFLTAQCVTVSSDNVWRPYLMPLAGPSSGSIGIGVQTTSSTSGDIYVDDGKLTTANLGQGTPPNHYTVTVSAADVESNYTPSGSNWVSCVDGGAGIKTCTFTNLTLGTTPNLGCTVTNDNRGICNITSKSTTGFTVNTINEGNPGTFADFQVDIWMEKTGSDYAQNAITSNQYNQGWTQYTPTFTGFGTVSNPFFEWKRDGGDMIIRGRWVNGTVSATEARISLPSGYTSLSTFPAGNTTQPCGRLLRNVSGSSAGNIACLIDQNFTYFRIGVADSGAATIMTPANGGTIASTGETMGVDNIRIPIQGWQETQNAPQLVQSVIYDTTVRTGGLTGVSSIEYSTYSATITNVANAASITSPITCTWDRLGPVVSVECRTTVGCTSAGGTSTSYNISLPISTTQGTTITGSVNMLGASGTGPRIVDNGSNIAQVQYACQSTTAGTHVVMFKYRVP